MLVCVASTTPSMSVTLAQAERVVGIRPKGDPVKMRATAETLKRVAEDFRAQRTALTATELNGSGGLIDRVNLRVKSRRTKLLNSALDLEHLATTLSLRAVALSDAQNEWQRDAKRRVPGWN